MTIIYLTWQTSPTPFYSYKWNKLSSLIYLTQHFLATSTPKAATTTTEIMTVDCIAIPPPWRPPSLSWVDLFASSLSFLCPFSLLLSVLRSFHSFPTRRAAVSFCRACEERKQKGFGYSQIVCSGQNRKGYLDSDSFLPWDQLKWRIPAALKRLILGQNHRTPLDR